MRAYALLLALLAVAPTAHAEERARADQAVPLMVRALGYDRGLRARAGGAVTIALVSREGDATAAQDVEQVARELAKLSEASIQGLPLRIVKLSLAPGDDLAARVPPTRASVLYVAAGFKEAEVTAIAAAAAKLRLLSVYRAAEYGGQLVLGVNVQEGKVRIVINLAAAKAAGVDFDAQLLRSAVVK